MNLKRTQQGSTLYLIQHSVLASAVVKTSFSTTGTTLSWLVQASLLAMLLVHTVTARQVDTGSRSVNVIQLLGESD